MHYVRFLKPLRLEANHNGTRQLKTLITLNTDLGESVFPQAASLEVSLLVNPGTEDEKCRGIKILQWNPSRDVLPFAWDVTSIEERDRFLALKILSAVCKGQRSHPLRINENSCFQVLMPEIIGAQSSVIDLKLPLNDLERGLIRLVPIGKSDYIRIWENAGNSIAGHVWDAGVALSACIADDTIRKVQLPILQSLVSSESGHKGPINAIELGSGCGVGGISLALTVSDCSSLLTDVVEAQATLKRNVEINDDQTGKTSDFSSRVRICLLDWMEDLPSSVGEQDFDLILISDCTYNPESSPALVKTISEIVGNSPTALVVVAMKKRHTSEEVFFRLMEKSQFFIEHHAHVRAPNHSIDYADSFTEEIIDIYTFKTSHLTQKPG